MNTMKILALSDIHGDRIFIREMAEKGAEEKVDLVLLAGDLVDDDGNVDGLIGPFKEKGLEVAIIPGNHEGLAEVNFLSEKYGIKNLHGYVLKVGEVGIFGCGYADIGIHQLSERQFFETLKKAHDSFGGMTDGWYTDYCHSSSHLFGCVGLRNKQYCILNKQYTKEEYEALVPRVIEHMNNMPYTDQQGRIYKYGEFFPPEFSPFAYNETIAQEYFPLAKAEALERGYRWKEPDAKDYAATRKPEDLPDHIKDVKDDILQETVGCAHAAPPAGGCNHQCTVAFKIIPKELEFYRRSTLPLPRLCPNCRHYERLAQRNPLRLWHRQ